MTLRVQSKWASNGFALLFPILATGQVSDPITVVSPAEGQVVRPGEVLPVVVEIDEEALTPVQVAIIPNFATDGLPNHFVPFPYETVIEVPEHYAGSARIDILVSTEQGEFVPRATKTVRVSVQPDSPVEALFVTDNSVLLHSPPHVNSSWRLSVKAVLASKQTVDVETAEVPVTFDTDNPGVVSVTEDGVITAVGPGRAWVTVNHQNLREWVEVEVADSVSGGAPPPADLTSEVAIQSLGFRVDPQTNHVVEEIYVTNISNGPLHRPFAVLVENLSAGLVLLSPDGRTRLVPPIGTPYMRMTLDGDSVRFMPGDSARVQLRFLNPVGGPIARNLRVVSAAVP